MTDYFAFVDSLERVGNRWRIRFDSVPAAELKNVSPSRYTQSDDKKFSSSVFELESASDELPGLGENRRLILDHWYKITVQDSEASVAGSLEMEQYSSPAVAYPSETPPDTEMPFNPMFLTNVEFIDGRTKVGLALKKAFSLDGFGAATKTEIVGALTVHSKRNLFVAVYRVGQGSCNAISESNGHALLYFDVGAAITNNFKTRPSNSLELCFDNHQPIVLSHWDMDHWALGQEQVAALDSKWIVPNQSVGVSHFKLAQRLHSKGNLLIWPNAIKTIKFPMGQIWKLNPLKDRNQSGLVFQASVGSSRNLCKVLLPGDAKYKKIPSAAKTSLEGLVVTHHGGAFTNDPPPKPKSDSHVYSFGKGNTYKHPRKYSVDNHINAGWIARRNTPSGSAAIPALVKVPIVPPCKTGSTPLRISQ